MGTTRVESCLCTLRTTVWKLKYQQHNASLIEGPWSLINGYFRVQNELRVINLLFTFQNVKKPVSSS